MCHFSTLSASDYEKVANLAMDVLHERLESLVEEYSPEGSNGWEVEYSVRFPPVLLAHHSYRC
jgi:hypothetical protein